MSEFTVEYKVDDGLVRNSRTHSFAIDTHHINYFSTEEDLLAELLEAVRIDFEDTVYPYTEAGVEQKFLVWAKEQQEAWKALMDSDATGTKPGPQTKYSGSSCPECMEQY